MSEYECVVGNKKYSYKKMELSLAKNSHWELCGARPGSSTVVVNSIGFAILAQVICACAYDYHRLRRWVSKGPKVVVVVGGGGVH